jgi:hypothetical protein
VTHGHDEHHSVDPDSKSTWLIGFVGGALFVATCLALTALFYAVKTESVHDQVIKQTSSELEAIRKAQVAQLNGPPRREMRLINGEQTMVAVIPIDQAMETVVQEARR